MGRPDYILGQFGETARCRDTNENLYSPRTVDNRINKKKIKQNITNFFVSNITRKRLDRFA